MRPLQKGECYYADSEDYLRFGTVTQTNGYKFLLRIWQKGPGINAEQTMNVRYDDMDAAVKRLDVEIGRLAAVRKDRAVEEIVKALRWEEMA